MDSKLDAALVSRPQRRSKDAADRSRGESIRTLTSQCDRHTEICASMRLDSEQSAAVVKLSDVGFRVIRPVIGAQMSVSCFNRRFAINQQFQD